MAKRLYVGNLSYGTTEEGLSDAFSQAGTVESAVVVMDRETGRARGFGFIEMSSDDEADRAIEILNDSELDGRRITVNEAKPRENRNGGGGRRSSGFGGGGYGRR